MSTPPREGEERPGHAPGDASPTERIPKVPQDPSATQRIPAAPAWLSPTEQLPAAPARPDEFAVEREPKRRARTGGGLLSAASAALLWGEIAFVAVAFLGELVAFAQVLIGNLGLGFSTTARIGGLYFFGFHHVPILVEATKAPVPGPILSMSLALMTGTVLGGALLFVGGRAVGKRAGGGSVVRALSGAAVALPYAGLGTLLSYAVNVSYGNALLNEAGFGNLSLSVSHMWAFVWPLVVGVLAGAAGGLWSLRAERPRGIPDRWAVGALVGGVSAFLTALMLSFLGLLVLAGVYPSATRGYAEATFGRGAPGVDALAHHLLALPNQSLWVLVPAMGGCDEAGSRDFLCYGRFPNKGDLRTPVENVVGLRGASVRPLENVGFGTAPAAYFLFLLVPLAAAVGGGAMGARDTRSRSEGAALGALGGVVFGSLVSLSAVLAGVELTVRFARGPASALTIGPDPVAGLLLGLAWGVAGGALGGLLAGGRGVRRPAGTGR